MKDEKIKWLGDKMKENKLADLSLDFAEKILKLSAKLRAKGEYIVSGQIGRSGTSIGANIHEANYAQGTKDFISKLEIALKEANETSYWLKLLHRTKLISEEEYVELSSMCVSLCAMLVSSCRTVKSKIRAAEKVK